MKRNPPLSIAFSLSPERPLNSSLSNQKHFGAVRLEEGVRIGVRGMHHPFQSNFPARRWNSDDDEAKASGHQTGGSLWNLDSYPIMWKPKSSRSPSKSRPFIRNEAWTGPTISPSRLCICRPMSRPSLESANTMNHFGEFRITHRVSPRRQPGP